MKLELNFPSISMCTTFVCVQVYVFKFVYVYKFTSFVYVYCNVDFF